ncbi:MAG: hypothetical protein H7A39_03260 [Chlamydiales bacterium]|nr:hypothetical protein [Chlamydiales bacterium]
MSKFGCNFFIVCASLVASSLFATEEPSLHTNDNIETAKLDAQRFKSALLRAQKSNREQVEKLSQELSNASSKTAQLQQDILAIQQENLTRIQSLKQELEQVQHKSANLQQELNQVRQNNQKQTAELTAQLASSQLEAQKIKNDLLAARNGNTTQIESLEADLNAAYRKIQLMQNDLSEAKSLNAKQLKNFTAWLYNAKNEADELKRQIGTEQIKYEEQLSALHSSLAAANQEKMDLKLELAKAKENYQDQLLTMQEQLVILQVQHEQMREDMENGQQDQENPVYPCCCPEPLPPIVCWRPNVEEPTSWVKGEILVWTAEAGNLDFVIPNFPVSSTNLGQTGTVEEAKFGWNPGFRVEVGHRFRPDFWELALQYTYMNIDGNDSFSTPSDPTRILMATKDNVNQVLASARSNVELFYNVFDLMLARSFLPTKQLIVRPSMGLTGTWMDRELDVKYHGVGSPSNETHSRDKWEFHGGGMRAGADFDWYLGSGFSLFGKSSLAALIGYYKNTFNADTNNVGGLAPATIENARYDDQRIATHLQMQMGPQWGKMWEDMGLLIFVGYELNAWFNVEEVRYSNPTDTVSQITPRKTVINTSTLGMQGFVGKIQFNF